MRAGRRIALIGGGVRSGKSAFALSLARSLGRRRAFIATAEPFDDEMRERIAAHIAERGADFESFETPLDLGATVASLTGPLTAPSAPRLGSTVEAPGPLAGPSAPRPGFDVIVIDCITLWLSNLLLRGDPPARIVEQIDALAHVIAAAEAHCVLVSNEVGMGVVPESALGRAFRDLSGRAHQRLGVVASELYMAMMGVVLRLRPAPVEIASEGQIRG